MNTVHWLIPLNSTAYCAISQSNLASIRLRVFPCTEGLRESGYPFTFGEQINYSADVIIIGKIGVNDIYSRTSYWLAQLNDAKSRGVFIYLDYTDHHLGVDTPMSVFYQKAVSLADCCIVSSKYMAYLLQTFYAGPIVVIEDSIEIELQPVKDKVFTNRSTALWFGHSSNIGFLIDFINSSYFLMTGCNLIVLSNESGLNIFHSSQFKIVNSQQIQLGIWSVDAMVRAAQVSDFCIIPSNLSNSKKLGASSNRLITSLALGLPTAADCLPSYKEFNQFYVDIRSSNFNILLTNPLIFSDQVLSAQSSIVNRFLLQKISSDWLKLLSTQ
jgi:hypothetical protein